MKVDQNMARMDAEIAFHELKQVCLALEARGMRPNVLVHPNGMPDRIEILPPHATTPQIEEIRRKRAHGS